MDEVNKSKIFGTIFRIESLDNDETQLYEHARNIRNVAYPVVTGIRFGCALLTNAGREYTGANIEEWGMIESRHAEMCAIDNMLLDRAVNQYGEAMSKDDITIKKLIVVGDPKKLGKNNPIFPCLSCLNLITQFSDSDTMVIAVDLMGNVRMVRIDELCPERAF